MDTSPSLTETQALVTGLVLPDLQSLNPSISAKSVNKLEKSALDNYESLLQQLEKQMFGQRVDIVVNDMGVVAFPKYQAKAEQKGEVAQEAKKCDKLSHNAGCRAKNQDSISPVGVDLFLNQAFKKFLLKKWKNAVVLLPESCPVTRKVFIDTCVGNNDTTKGHSTKVKNVSPVKNIAIVNLGYNQTSIELKTEAHDIDVTSMSIFMAQQDPQVEKSNDGSFALKGSESSQKNLNFPIYSRSNQLISENEFIYLFERVIIPVLEDQSFDLICINIDAKGLFGEYKPLFTLNYIAVIHLLSQIRKIADSNLLVLIDQVPNSTIIDDFLACALNALAKNPDSSDSIKIAEECNRMVKNSHPTELFLNDHRLVVETWSKFVPALQTGNALAYEQSVQSIVMRKRYLAGGHQDELEINGDYLFKVAKDGELAFYRDIYPTVPKLHEFLPRVYDISQKNNAFVIKMQNLTRNGNFSLLDMKLTNDVNKRKITQDFYNKYFFYVPGYAIKDENGIIIERRYKFCKGATEQQMFDLFARFFNFESAENAHQKLSKIIDFIEFSLKIAKENNYNYTHASYLLLYDRNTGKVKIRLIDMNYFSIGSNEETCNSIKGVLRFLRRFVKKVGGNK